MKTILIVAMCFMFTGCSTIEKLGIKAGLSADCTGVEIGTPEYGINLCATIKTGPVEAEGESE